MNWISHNLFGVNTHLAELSDSPQRSELIVQFRSARLPAPPPTQPQPPPPTKAAPYQPSFASSSLTATATSEFAPTARSLAILRHGLKEQPAAAPPSPLPPPPPPLPALQGQHGHHRRQGPLLCVRCKEEILAANVRVKFVKSDVNLREDENTLAWAAKCFQHSFSKSRTARVIHMN